MIKREVIHRADVKTVYSSQKQERMKVYFELTKQYKECMEPCKLHPVQTQEACKAGCQKIYEKYIEILKPRYENNKQRIDMEVKNSQIFTVRQRKDRSGWFFDLFDTSFRQFLGLEPNVAP